MEDLSLLFDATVDELGIHTLLSQDLLSGLGRTERIGLRTGRGRLLRGGNSLGRARLKLHGHTKAITTAGINTKGMKVRDGRERTRAQADHAHARKIPSCQNRNLRKKYSFSPADAGVPSADRPLPRHRRHPRRIPHPHGATPGDLRSHQPMNSSLLGILLGIIKNRPRRRRGPWRRASPCVVSL